MPRQRIQIDHEQIQRLKAEGHSIREIASELRLGRGTIHRLVKGFGTAPRRSKTAKPEDYGSTESSVSPAGISLAEIKRWRQAEFDAGRPSGLRDFWAQRGFCFDCRAEHSACRCSGSESIAAGCLETTSSFK